MIQIGDKLITLDNTISKADLIWALNNIKLKKNGKEIKEHLPAKKENLLDYKAELKEVKGKLKSYIKEKFDLEPEGKQFGWEVREKAGENGKYLSLYNEICYALRRIKENVEMIDVLMTIKDSETFELTPNELLALNSSVDMVDIDTELSKEIGIDTDVIEKAKRYEFVTVHRGGKEFKQRRLIGSDKSEAPKKEEKPAKKI